jgi:hypothetical protein
MYAPLNSFVLLKSLRGFIGLNSRSKALEIRLGNFRISYEEALSSVGLYCTVFRFNKMHRGGL